MVYTKIFQRLKGWPFVREIWRKSFFICFISRVNQSFSEQDVCGNIAVYKCSVLNWTDMSNCHPLEVVGRGSETKLQVGEILIW